MEASGPKAAAFDHLWYDFAHRTSTVALLFQYCLVRGRGIIYHAFDSVESAFHDLSELVLRPLDFDEKPSVTTEACFPLIQGGISSA